jgi:hypothetical protein
MAAPGWRGLRQRARAAKRSRQKPADALDASRPRRGARKHRNAVHRGNLAMTRCWGAPA